MADFLAACFWPFIIVAGIALTLIHGRDLHGRVLVPCAAVGLAALFLLMFFSKYSIVAVLDIYIAAVFAGLFFIGYALVVRVPSSPFRDNGWRGRLREIGARGLIFAIGVGMAGVCGFWLVQDVSAPFVVLEGRVSNPRVVKAHRQSEYVAEIDGHTVNVTIPIYERLKYLPIVRAEVGRGSNYVYRIEYLSN